MKAQLFCSVLVALVVAAASGDLIAEPAGAVSKRIAGPDFGRNAATPGTSDGTDCPGILFTKNLKYAPAELNVLDVAGSAGSAVMYPRPVLLFVAGESFTDPAGSGPSGKMLEQAMCLAARNGLVAVRMSYRLAPKNRWPAAAQDVAAAVSWINDNIDLFGGDRKQIIAIGYSVGAFHLASSLAHPELRVQHSTLAGIVLLSGSYRIGIHSSESVKEYIGHDPAKYRERSIFPGILFANDPLLLAWSINDPGHVVAESEELRGLICEARRGICPRHAILQGGGSMAAVIDLLGEPIQSLIREIEARGLP